MEWKLILQTGGKGISREGQEFGGGGGTSRFCASLFLSFHCSPFSAIISDQGRTRGFFLTRVCVVVDLHFLALRLASFRLGVFRAGTWSRAILGLQVHIGSRRSS